MPYDIQTKDGITIRNIPDDVPPDSPSLKARVAEIRAAGGASALAPPEGPSATVAGMAGGATRGLAPVTGGALLGAAAGAPFAGVGAGPGALAGAALGAMAKPVGDPLVNAVNAAFGTQFSTPSQIIEDALTKAGVALPQAPAERVVQAVTEGAAGGAGSVALGRTLQAAASPVTRGVGDVLAQQPVAQIMGGAGAGGGGQIAQEAGAGPGGQLLASVLGGITGSAMVPRERQQAAGLQQIVDAARQRNIPVMTSDVAPPDTFAGQIAQRAGERVPFVGTGPLRAQQQQSRIAAVKDLLANYGALDAANLPDDIMRDLASKRSADLQKYSTLKNEVIDRLAQTGQPVPVPNATQAIDDQIAKLVKLNTDQVKPVISVLKDWKQSIQNQDLRTLEENRKLIGSAFTAPELSAVRGVGESALSAVYGPLRQDMQTFIAQNGAARDVTKWTVANKRLSSLAGELEMGTLKSVLQAGNQTPEAVERLLFSKKPSEIKALYSGLTSAGRASARAAILARAAKAAEYEVEDGTRLFSPERFNAALTKLQPQIGVFFDKQDMEQVQGLSRALTLTRRASQAGVSTATGQEAVPFVAGSMLQSLFGTMLGTVAAAATVGSIARVYESAPVRNTMIRLGRTAPGSAEEAQLAKRLMATIQTQYEALSQSAEGK